MQGKLTVDGVLEVVDSLRQVNFAFTVHFPFQVHHRLQLVHDSTDVSLQEAQLPFLLPFNLSFQVGVTRSEVVERCRVMILEQEVAGREVLTRQVAGILGENFSKVVGELLVVTFDGKT
jgi:hypothetical protein